MNCEHVLPNPRLQRTPSAPLSRQPLGGRSGLALLVVLAVGCQTGAARSDSRDRGEVLSSVPALLSPSGIGLQSDREAVTKALGAPGAERPQPYDNWRYDYGDMVVLDYPGIRFRLVGGIQRTGKFRVLEIEIANPVWTVTPGLYVGMDKATAVQHLPSLREGTDVRCPGQRVLTYRFAVSHTHAGGKLLLVLNSKKVISQIIMTSDLD